MIDEGVIVGEHTVKNAVEPVDRAVASFAVQDDVQIITCDRPPAHERECLKIAVRFLPHAGRIDVKGLQTFFERFAVKYRGIVGQINVGDAVGKISDAVVKRNITLQDARLRRFLQQHDQARQYKRISVGGAGNVANVDVLLNDHLFRYLNETAAVQQGIIQRHEAAFLIRFVFV